MSGKYVYCLTDAFTCTSYHSYLPVKIKRVVHVCRFYVDEKIVLKCCPTSVGLKLYYFSQKYTISSIGRSVAFENCSNGISVTRCVFGYLEFLEEFIDVVLPEEAKVVRCRKTRSRSRSW
jgi:hypothetical protein